MALIDTKEIPGPIMHVEKYGTKIIVRTEYNPIDKEKFLALQKDGWTIIKVVRHEYEAANFTATMIFMGKPGK